MKFKSLLFLALLIGACQPAQKSLVEWVNPFIGTGGHGHTYPGPSSPFGMVQLSPDTRLEGWDGCGGYHYTDSYIYGFSHTHLSGTGISDYADVLLMPKSRELIFNNGADGQPGYRSSFSHDNENAQAGYYQVFLEDENINVELTATPRVGFHKYNYEKGDSAKLIIDLQHRDRVLDAQLQVIDSLTIRGYRYSSEWANDQRVHFYLKLSHPFQELSFNNDSLIAGFEFGILDEPLQIKVAISPVDMLGAQQNMEAEVPLIFEQMARDFSDDYGLGIIFHMFQDDNYLISRIISIFYTLTTHSEMLGKTISVAIGTASIFLFYHLTLLVWENKNIALRASWVFALMPSLCLFSSLILREVYVTFFLIIEYILREFLVLSKNIKVLIFILVPSARLELALRKRQGF